MAPELYPIYLFDINIILNGYNDNDNDNSLFDHNIQIEITIYKQFK